MMKYYDFLYGEIELEKEILELCQTKVLARLRDISLSAVHPRIVPAGDFISRFKHSLGVVHLAEILCTKPEFESFQKELTLAALLHDVGSPPFSHCAEHFQSEVFGKDHESCVGDILDSSEIKTILKGQRVSLEEVVSIIKGEQQPLGKLINGTIDLDNLDNSLRFGLSGGILEEKIYDPEHLALSFDLRHGEIFILKGYAEEIEKWEECRRKVYQWVYDDRNLSPGMMMFRALEFAYFNGELAEDFFYLTESEAFSYLTEKCSRATRELVEDALRWRFFVRAAEYITRKPTTRVKELCSGMKQRKYLADRVAEELKITKKDVCVYTGKDKGYKKIKIPFIDEGGKTGNFVPKEERRWIIKVYIDPEYTGKIKEAQTVLSEIISERPSGEAAEPSDLW